MSMWTASARYSTRETSLPSWASCGSKWPHPLLARSGLACAEAGSLNCCRTQQSTNCSSKFDAFFLSMSMWTASARNSTRETSLPSWASCDSKRPQPLLARSGLTCAEAGSLSCCRLPPCRNQKLALHCAGRSSRPSLASTGGTARDSLASPRTSCWS